MISRLFFTIGINDVSRALGIFFVPCCMFYKRLCLLPPYFPFYGNRGQQNGQSQRIHSFKFPPFFCNLDVDASPLKYFKRAAGLAG